MRPARAKRVERAPTAEAGAVQEGLSKDSYTQVLELEHQLLTTIQFKGHFDPNVSILRRNIRELYESIILEDHEFAELHDIEQSLWRLHHTCIEEYRARIRKNTPPAGTAAPGNKSVVRREPVQKVKAVFRAYLAEATGFYHDLFLKIGAKHGISQDDLTYSSLMDKSLKKDDKRVAELRRCQRSCHRCLIFLGDLARYKESCGDRDTKSNDWSIAAGFYVRAASMWPSSGNPYNQLAVLATYIGDEMLAVYHYFRSLASETPFLTAKDNLVLLFEKNRHSYLRLVALSAGNSSQTTKTGKGKIKAETQVHQVAGSENAGLTPSSAKSSEQKAVRMDLLRNFRVRFVRLNGILFTRTSLEAFSEVHSSILSDLEELLMIKETDEEVPSSPISLTLGRNWGTGPSALLQLISILIFSVHNINVGSGPETHQPTYAEILQRSVVLAHAFIALFECVGHILQHCARLNDLSNNLFLPAILVVMEWLSCRPEITLGNDAKEKEATARMFFWRNCVSFLNKFTGVVGPAAADDVKDRVSLWEDFELWGFTPMLPIQHNLNNGKKPEVGLGSVRERHARVERLKHAGKVFADMFVGTDKGMHYDVETDAFYVMGDKSQDKKKVDAPASVENHIVPPPRSVIDDKKFKQASELKATSMKVCLPVEEEDEEVIVFKPSSKTRGLPVLSTNSKSPVEENNLTVSKSLTQKISNTVYESSTSTTQLDVPVESRNSWAMESAALSMAVPLAVPSAIGLSPSLSGNLQKLSEPTDWAAQVSGPVNDFNVQVFGSAGLDSKLEHGSFFQVPLLDSSGLLDKDSRAPGSHLEPSQPLGSTVDWGFTGFGLQPSRNLNPSSVNWHLHDCQGNNSLWSTELHKVAPSKGAFKAESGLNRPVLKTFTSTDPPLGPVQSMSMLTAAQGLSESFSVPSHSIAPHERDAFMQMKPKLQEHRNVITGANVGPYELTEELALLGAKLKLNSEILSDVEKPARPVTTLPSSMRPPPGFGPLPAKPPVSLPAATSTFQTSQSVLLAHASPNAILQQNMLTDQSGSLSSEEHVDDYTWLDGYTPPPKIETSQSSVLGLGRKSPNTNYGWLSGGFLPAMDATAPFPGMKTVDRYSSPPPNLAPRQQPPPSQALLRQELLHIQQTQEQYQQQLLQEQRLQQFYNAQIAAQRHHMQQGDQQPPPSLPQQPLLLQQQMPPSSWPGQNSIVS